MIVDKGSLILPGLSGLHERDGGVKRHQGVMTQLRQYISGPISPECDGDIKSCRPHRGLIHPVERAVSVDFDAIATFPKETTALLLNGRAMARQ
jgi:hypothetical protein